MRNGLIFVQSVALLLGFSSNVLAMDPPVVPSAYEDGPEATAVESTDLSESERIGITLLESVLHVAEAKIAASSCAASIGEYPLTVLSDVNFKLFESSVLSLGGSYQFVADPQPVQQIDVNIFVQQIDVRDKGVGFFSGLNVGGFVARAIYDPKANNKISQDNAVSLFLAKDGVPERYSSQFSSVLYHGSEGPNIYEVYGTGLQHLEKFSYPISKYWHRAKLHRGQGGLGRTVIVKDLLVGGDESCRVMADVSGTNDGLEFFFQKGKLVIRTLKPSSPTPELTQPPFFL